jgi:hypothetical protein
MAAAGRLLLFAGRRGRGRGGRLSRQQPVLLATVGRPVCSIVIVRSTLRRIFLRRAAIQRTLVDICFLAADGRARTVNSDESWTGGPVAVIVTQILFPPAILVYGGAVSSFRVRFSLRFRCSVCEWAVSCCVSADSDDFPMTICSF